MPFAVRTRNANPLWRRLIRRWRQWRGAELGKTHQVHFIKVDGQTFKRVRFSDLSEANSVSTALEALSGLDRFPALVRQDGREVWTGFVPGKLAEKRSLRHQALVADFFVDLYRVPAAVNPPDPGTLDEDLDFLLGAGLLTQPDVHRVARRAEQLRPDRIVAGYDYIDPVPKNFVIADHRAIGIDVEAVLAGMPLGTGLAKARLRWLGDGYQRVLSGLVQTGGVDLRGQYPWVELCFLARYFRQKVMQGKPGHIRIKALLQKVP